MQKMKRISGTPGPANGCGRRPPVKRIQRPGTALARGPRVHEWFLGVGVGAPALAAWAAPQGRSIVALRWAGRAPPRAGPRSARPPTPCSPPLPPPAGTPRRSRPPPAPAPPLPSPPGRRPPPRHVPHPVPPVRDPPGPRQPPQRPAGVGPLPPQAGEPVHHRDAARPPRPAHPLPLEHLAHLRPAHQAVPRRGAGPPPPLDAAVRLVHRRRRLLSGRLLLELGGGKSPPRRRTRPGAAPSAPAGCP